MTLQKLYEGHHISDLYVPKLKNYVIAIAGLGYTKMKMEKLVILPT